MEVLKKYGFEFNGISIVVGAIVCAISFYIIYNYLHKEDRDKKNDDTYILVYSIVPSIILGILTIFVYSKYLNGTLPFGNGGDGSLLQEDFYG